MWPRVCILNAPLLGLLEQSSGADAEALEASHHRAPAFLRPTRFRGGEITRKNRNDSRPANRRNCSLKGYTGYEIKASPCGTRLSVREVGCDEREA